MEMMMDLTEADVVSLEGVANTLRGMTMDPSIPAHAIRVMRTLIAEVEAITERFNEDEDEDEDEEPDPDRLRDDRDERRRLDDEAAQ